MLNTALAILLILLQLADGYTTYRVIYERVGFESNKVQAALAEILPGKWTWLGVAKTVGIAFSIGLVWLPFGVYTLIAIAIFGGLHLYAVINNIGVMRRRSIR